eukprot:1009461-Pelagomonas_calceolata.AAC.1
MHTYADALPGPVSICPDKGTFILQRSCFRAKLALRSLVTTTRSWQKHVRLAALTPLKKLGAKRAKSGTQLGDEHHLLTMDNKAPSRPSWQAATAHSVKVKANAPRSRGDWMVWRVWKGENEHKNCRLSTGSSK